MNQTHIRLIAQMVGVREKQVENTIQLLIDKSTIPFISRYRKEVTGGLDEVQIATIDEQFRKLEELEKRRAMILETIESQGKLTDELRKKIESTYDPTELEDLYLPYKPKKRTRAMIARENGLEPLSKILFEQKIEDIEKAAQSFLNEKVTTIDDALQGARDIIAEEVSENLKARNIIRNIFDKESIIRSKVIKGKEEEGVKYKDYFAFEEPLSRCPSHRLLAMRRGEEEDILRVSISPSEENSVESLKKLFVNKYAKPKAAKQVETAVTDGYKRLLQPSIETEFSNTSKEKADNEAIKVFSANLHQLLLAAPLGQKRVLALDPGYRTGCKVVCLDEQGNLVHNEAIYPHPPQSQTKEAARKIEHLVEAYRIDSIAIGNGTASRETEHFIKKQVHFDRDINVFVVSENGASVYSASSVAREEFPQYDVTVRGAISIGRRLMDPLAELVKIDPKSIGVGQYQHDVNQNRLKESLDRVVESCVNLVGVNVNTASKHLLTYVSGLGASLAQNIVEYRKEKGAFHSRGELLNVKRMGTKAFEQCAGFLRIPDSDNPLDNSAVHPESYAIVERMAVDLNCKVKDLLKDENLRKKIDLKRYVNNQVGLPTLTDIVNELAKPGRDPRTKIKVFEFSANVHTIADLHEGMTLPGIVTNITNFGAFVDVGVKQDGLVHISQMCDRFITNPSEVVTLHQHVQVKVVEVDVARKRIQLTMKLN